MSASRILGQSLNSGLFFGINYVGRFLLAIALGRTLSSQDYGSFSLVTATVGMTLNFATLCAHYYYVREVPGRSPEEGIAKFMSVVGMQTLILGVIVGAILAYGPSRTAASGFLGGLDGTWTIVVVGVLLVVEPLVTDVVRYLWARSRIEQGNFATFVQGSLWGWAAFGLMLIAPSLLQLSTILALWLVADLLAIGYGGSRIGGTIIRGARLSASAYITAVRFGLPMLAAGLPTAAMALARFLLLAFHSLTVTGVFSFHYNLIVMIGAFSGPVASSPIEPYAVASYNTGDIARSGRLLSIGLRYRLLLMVPFLVIAAVWQREVVTLMARRDYTSDVALLGLLSPVPVLSALTATFERVLFLERRTATIAWCYGVGAVIQAVLYVALIKLDPYYGVVAATDVGMGIGATVFWYQTRSSAVRIDTAFRRLLSVTAVVAATGVAVVLLLAAAPAIVSLALGAVAVLLCAAFASRLFGAVSAAEERIARDFFFGPTRRALTHIGLGRND